MNVMVCIRDLYKKVEKLYAIIYTEDNINMAVENSKGAVCGTVNLAQDLAFIKHDLNILTERFNKLLEKLQYGK